MPSKRPASSKTTTPERVFGTLLRALRRELGISQEEMAHRSGYSRNFVGLVERGEHSPTLRTIFDFADVLGRMPSEMVAEVEKSRKARK